MNHNGRDCCYHQVLVSPELGGGGHIALHVADFLNRQGRVSSVWIPGDGPARRQAKTLGLSTQDYSARAVFSHWRIKAALGNWRLGWKLRRQGAGIVHVHSPHFYGALQLGLRLAGLRRIAHVHLEDDPAGLRWAFRHPPDLIITCARFLVDYVRRTLPERRQQEARIVAVPNAADTERFQPGDKQEAKRRLNAPANRPLAIMLANLAPHKGQETAIRATALLTHRGISITTWLAGIERDAAGAFTARLRSLITELGVGDRVQLLGYRNDPDTLLRAADFFLLPSTCEGLPLSVLEAQATKVPVLAAPTAGIPEVVSDGQTGFLIAADDPAGYANRIAGLLGNRDLVHGVTANAYENVLHHHTWRAYCEQIWELYQELLGPVPSPSSCPNVGPAPEKRALASRP